jgi:energy-coupling factor transporter ATP-binding protein EcfA2
MVNIDEIKGALSWTITDAGNHLLKGFHELLPAKKAKNIIILGMQGAGKTTLWNRLGGIKEVRSNTTIKLIPPFKYKLENGRKVKVVYENEKYNVDTETAKHRRKKKNGGVDIGGQDSYTPQYDNLIIPDSFVYYIVDATKIHEYDYYRKIRSDFRKIDSVIKEKKISENQFGFKVLLSHYDEWAKLHPESGSLELFDSFFDKMNGMSPDGLVRGQLCKKDNSHLQAVNLLNDNDVERIKEAISKV